MIEEEKLFVEINEKEFKISNIKGYGIGHGVIDIEVDDDDSARGLEKGVGKWRLLFSALIGKDASCKTSGKKIIKKKATYLYISTYTGDEHKFTGSDAQISRWVCRLRKDVGRGAFMIDCVVR